MKIVARGTNRIYLDAEVQYGREAVAAFAVKQ
jgi:hypothetical protein